MRWPHPAADFVFQNGPQDLQPGLPGQLLHLRLHLRPHLGHSARAPAPATLVLRLLQTCDWTCALSSGNSFSRRFSPLKGILNPNFNRVRARAAASFSQRSTKSGPSSGFAWTFGNRKSTLTVVSTSTASPFSSTRLNSHWE